MRTEVSYLPLELVDADETATPEERAEPHRFQRITYFRTGEFVEPGDYTCTYCGTHLHLGRACALPLCGTCDTDEFLAHRPVEPTRRRVRHLFAA